jgi:hypothetical protein
VRAASADSNGSRSHAPRRMKDSDSINVRWSRVLLATKLQVLHQPLISPNSIFNEADASPLWGASLPI